MKAKVLDNLCIGCGACAALVPEEFDFNDDGLAMALNEEVKEANKELVKEAEGNCPTGAIKVEE